MKNYLLFFFLFCLSCLPIRAQIEFSDSVRITLVTASLGPDAYERFGHTAIRIQDMKNPRVDVVFHYGVFSFNTPDFMYRFVKGETDYKLGLVFTNDFIAEYRERGLGMTEQWLSLDKEQSADLITRLKVNYLPENRTYRYNYFFDNCATRPYRLLLAITNQTIKLDSVWSHPCSLRELVQEKTGVGTWLDFGIALALSSRADVPTTYEERFFMPDYLASGLYHANIPTSEKGVNCELPLVKTTDTLLMLRSEVEQKINERSFFSPNIVCALILLVALGVTLWEHHIRTKSRGMRMRFSRIATTFDCVFMLALGLTGVVVWFLCFFSQHPAVGQNLNCLWLLPTHMVLAFAMWSRYLRKQLIYYGIFAVACIILYWGLNYKVQQYCPPAFVFLQVSVILRSLIRVKQNI